MKTCELFNLNGITIENDKVICNTIKVIREDGIVEDGIVGECPILIVK